MAQEVGSPTRAGTVHLLIGGVLGLASFSYFLSLPPTLNASDESYILYEAKRVLQGQAPYRDFFDFLLPGSYYFYALAYAVGGTTITSAKVATALLQTLCVVCAYALSLYVASVGEAVAVGLLVAVICVPVWNMASYHWIASAFGIAAGAVLLAPRWRDSSRGRPAATGMLAGVVVCTHQGRGTWLIACIVVTTLLFAIARRSGSPWRRGVHELAWMAAGGAAVCLPIIGSAVWRSSFAEMWYATYTFVVENYRENNVGASHLFGQVRWGHQTFPKLARYTYSWLLDSIPAMLAIELVALLWVIVRGDFRSQVMRVALLLLALGAVGSVAYFPGIAHVIFVTPFVLPVLAGMVYRTRTGVVFLRNEPARSVLRVAWAVGLAILLMKGWNNRQVSWAETPAVYHTAFGTIAGPKRLQRAIDALREKLQVDETEPPRMFVYPMDAWIYLALPADNPTRFSLLRRHNSAEQFEEAMESLDRDPQALVLVNRPLVKAGDPFMEYLRGSFHSHAKIGGNWFELYARDAASPADR